MAAGCGSIRETREFASKATFDEFNTGEWQRREACPPRFVKRVVAVSADGTYTSRRLGALAQLAEQLTLNQRVDGSSPSRPTN
jgi:hypothetical protein